MSKKQQKILNSLPSIPRGFSQQKNMPTYWDDACKDFWAETGLDTDCCDLAIIVAWFDKRRDKNL